MNPPFVFSIDISESGKMLAAGLGNGSVAILELTSNTPIGLLNEQTSLPVSQVYVWIHHVMYYILTFF